MTYSIEVKHSDITNEVIKLNNNGFTVIKSKILPDRRIEILYRYKVIHDSSRTSIENKKIEVITVRKTIKKRISYTNSCEKQTKHI